MYIVDTQKKYSPKSLDDFIFPNEAARELVTAYASGEIEQPLILHGSNGTGKSLLQELIPNAIEGRRANPQVVKCADIKSADDVYDLYGRNKHFNRTFTIDGQRYNYIIIEEFSLTNAKIIDAFKIELEKTLGTDLTIMSTNRFDQIDDGIKSRSLDLELQPCEPHVFFPHARRMFQAEGRFIDDSKLLKCLQVTYAVTPDNRKYYQALDRIFRTL